MNSGLVIPLNTTAEQAARLEALQTAFAEVCNALGPVVRSKRCWHRVTLHHLTYHALREQFPRIGSQMICNAIYSVCRTSRQVYQNSASPFCVSKRPDAPLPLIRFAPSAPVYFDRHTLSIKNGKLSMYTLDGRMRFQLDLKAEDLERFHNEKLREIVLSRAAGGYRLSFVFQPLDEADELREPDAGGDLPEYLIVLSERELPMIPEAFSSQTSSAMGARVA